MVSIGKPTRSRLLPVARRLGGSGRSTARGTGATGTEEQGLHRLAQALLRSGAPRSSVQAGHRQRRAPRPPPERPRGPSPATGWRDRTAFPWGARKGGRGLHGLCPMYITSAKGRKRSLRAPPCRSCTCLAAGFVRGSIMTLFMLKCFSLHPITASKPIKISGACTDPGNNKLA